MREKDKLNMKKGIRDACCTADISIAVEVVYWWSSSGLLVPQTATDTRAAKRAGIGELDSSIAKDLIDSEDPKHTLFCRKIAFAAIYALFRDNITIF